MGERRNHGDWGTGRKKGERRENKSMCITKMGKEEWGIQKNSKWAEKMRRQESETEQM